MLDMWLWTFNFMLSLLPLFYSLAYLIMWYLQTTLLPSSEPFDFMRTLRMGGYGLFIVGPTLPVWFNFVSRHFPETDGVTTLKKIVMSQSTYGPFMTVIFFSSNAFLQGISCSPGITISKAFFSKKKIFAFWYRSSLLLTTINLSSQGHRFRV